MVDEQEKSHRAGIWKQQNKPHKTGRHRSKGQIDLENKGKVSVRTLTKKALKERRKVDRRHHALQIRAKKREEVLRKKRNIGSRNAPPHLVAVIPLHQDTDIGELLEKIRNIDEEQATVRDSKLKSAGFTINVSRLKHRFTFISPTSPSLPDILDCGLVADTILFLLSVESEDPIDSQGHVILSTLFAQGLSASVLTTMGLDKVPIKKRSETKKMIHKSISKNFPDSKLHNVDTEQDVLLMLRTVAEQKRKSVNLRQQRPYLLADNFTFECKDGEDKGMLAVTGFLRGANLDVNRLVHVVGWGDFQINRINAATDPSPTSLQRKQRKTIPGGDATMDNGLDTDINANIDMSSQETLAKFDPDERETLVKEAVIDPLDAEQTWPTEDEMKEAEEAIKEKKKLVKNVPKGTSEYQAAWILDSDEEWEEKNNDDEDDLDSDDEIMEEDDELKPTAEEDSQVDPDEFEQIRVSESTQDYQFETMSQYDEGMDIEEEERALERYREERSHKLFPDEIDTPHDLPARVRFQKYRGLRSFRTSPWDTKENLPLDYARIFQFQNFNRTRKRLRMLEVDEAVKQGMYVTLYLEDVPKVFVESHSSQIIIYGMFPHEQKMSVVHMALKRGQGRYEDIPVKNKDEMLFYVGFRRFRAKPLFSQHTNGDKHKMERYLQKESVSVASVYSQILFPPANVMMFKETSTGILPIASGNVFKVDPDRVVTKRIVLSGHPFRIHKHLATIRYMFFNPDDILWFKPVELRTKWGRRGHIKEALGTHGHMKCTFDSQLTSQDTVLMNLYKRVYPKWSYDLITPVNRTKVDFHDSDHALTSKEIEFDDEFFD
ncbi:pre-rRNA-processing protein TSR1 homolog [Styela clava]